MKKLLTLTLCLLLVLVVFAPCTLADTPELHTLWDMPLDITADEFEEFIKEKIPIDFRREALDDDDDYINIVNTLANEFSMFEKPVYRMRASFLNQTPYTLDNISFWLDREGEDFDSGVDELRRLYKIFTDRYGPSTHSRVGFLSRKGKDERTLWFEMPIKDGEYDFDRLVADIVDDDDAMFVTMSWGNISIWKTCSPTIVAWTGVSLYSTIEEYETLPPYDTKPMPLPNDISDAFS